MIRASSDVATIYRHPSLGCAGFRLGWAASDSRFGNLQEEIPSDG